jgi:hypothetical protein
LNSVSPRDVLALVASAFPAQCRDNVVIVGSLAAGYHLLGARTDGQVRTKDVDCLLFPRVEAARAGSEVARQLLEAGWRPRTDGEHGQPGDASTPEESLPAVRLYPPSSTDWFIELLAAHEPADRQDRRWMRLSLAGGHFGLPSYRYLDVAIHDAPLIDLGVRCARPEMLALSNLLRNTEIRPETMAALVEARRIKRSNKDLGRVLAIARLSDPDAPRAWTGRWLEALQACHPESWRTLASQAGDGLRALLRSEVDLEEACLTCNYGLLAQQPITPGQLRRLAERVILDAVEPLEVTARQSQPGHRVGRG